MKFLLYSELIHLYCDQLLLLLRPIELSCYYAIELDTSKLIVADPHLKKRRLNITSTYKVIITVSVKNLRFSPPSEHSNINWFSRFSTNFFRFAFSKAVHIWWSLYSSNGSRFILNVPENKTGSFNFDKMIFYEICNDSFFLIIFLLNHLWYNC